MASVTKRTKSFRVRWLDHLGERKSATFLSHREALEFVRKKEVEADEIKHGIRTPVDFSKTLNDALDYWLENRSPKKRSTRDDISIIKTHLRPCFGSLPLRQISVQHTDAYVLTKSKEILDKTISNHLTLLISVLNVAVDLGWLDKVPKIKKPKAILFSDDFRYLRSDDEIERFLRSAQAEGPLVHIFYKTSLCTGLRAGEVAGLRLEDVDFKNRLIRVQRSFDGPTKSGKVRFVPILDKLFDDLLQWTNRIGSGVLFPNQHGNMHTPSARIFQEILHRVLLRAGFEASSTFRGKSKPYIVFHDLRHTFASTWVMKGGDLFKLQKILGHQSVQMTMRYAHLAPHAFNDDLHRFGRSELSDSKNVIPLRR